MRLLRTSGFSFLLWACSAGLAMAEDPIVVHYSDPSLTRLEKQLGITAAQRDRFDDIVVKYRDPSNQIAATNGNESDTRLSTGKGTNGDAAERAGLLGEVDEISHVKNLMSWLRF